MDRNKIPLEPRHLGVPSGASKMISELMVRLAQTVHISCTNTNTIQTDRNEIPLERRHLGVPSRASKTISKPIVCLAQTEHLSNTVSKWTEMRFHMTHVT